MNIINNLFNNTVRKSDENNAEYLNSFNRPTYNFTFSRCLYLTLRWSFSLYTVLQQLFVKITGNIKVSNAHYLYFIYRLGR